MTRFARAKGSKASNERLPEEATSWQEMKQQMERKKQEAEDLKKQKEFEVQRRENYQNFLEECEKDKKETWAEFEDKSNEQKQKRKQKNGETIDKLEENHAKNKKQTIVETNDHSDEDDAPVEVSAKVEPENVVIKKKKVKKAKVVIPSVGKQDKSVGEEKNCEEQEVQKPKKVKKGKKLTDMWDENKKILEKKEKTKNQGDKNKKKGEKPQKVKKPESELTEAEKLKIKKSKEKKLRQLEKRKLKKAEEKAKNEASNATENNQQHIPTQNHQNNNFNNSTNQNTPKNRKRNLKNDSKDHKRRKPAVESTSMIINGIEVKISYFDGFPVKTEDAIRLNQLRKQMISKGINRSEIQAALKLERRKAEKALAREKKKVCFNCRKSGHNLSECPSLNENGSQETIGSGICFKCGSTEHTHFECKVVRDDNYKFATCFICKEQGHISRQCPDNNRGLYPKGGACKVCGDVTHLKKDCPKYQAQQEALTLTADTIKFDDVEDLDGSVKASNSSSSRSNKIVKF